MQHGRFKDVQMIKVEDCDGLTNEQIQEQIDLRNHWISNVLMGTLYPGVLATENEKLRELLIKRREQKKKMVTKAANNTGMRWETTEPCASCPYRTDAKLEFWHPGEFVNLQEQDANEYGGAIFGCHGTRKLPEGPSVCAGWLLDQKRRNIPSIQLRLCLMVSEEARDCLEEVNDGGHDLYDSIEEMCEANNIPTREEQTWLSSFTTKKTSPITKEKGTGARTRKERSSTKPKKKRSKVSKKSTKRKS